MAGLTEGGRWFTDQVVELIRRGHHVEAVVAGPGTAMSTLRDSNVPVHVLPFRGYRPADLPRVARESWHLRSLIRDGKFDIVHSHLLKSSVLCRVAAWNLPVRVITQVPGVVHLASPALRAIDVATMRRDDLLLASCTAFEQTYRALGAPRTALSFYGCRTDHLDPDSPAAPFREEQSLPDSAVAVGMVAHMYPSRLKAFQGTGIKGHETFIDAARLVATRSPNVRFFIVGDEFFGGGAYRRALEDRAEDLVARGVMRFLGHRSDMESVLAGLDILVNPSLSESGSFTAVEASLMRKPVIASAVGGLLDTVVDGRTGLLVEPADPTVLADAILALVDDPARRKIMGERGRPHVTALFDLDATIASVEKSYARVMARPGTRPSVKPLRRQRG